MDLEEEITSDEVKFSFLSTSVLPCDTRPVLKMQFNRRCTSNHSINHPAINTALGLWMTVAVYLEHGSVQSGQNWMWAEILGWVSTVLGQDRCLKVPRLRCSGHVQNSLALCLRTPQQSTQEKTNKNKTVHPRDPQLTSVLFLGKFLRASFLRFILVTSMSIIESYLTYSTEDD